MPTLKDIDDSLFETSTSFYAAHDPDTEHPTMLMIHHDGGVDALPLDPLMQNELGKDIVAALIKKIVSRPEVSVAVFIGEAWTVSRKGVEPPPDISISECPDRREALIAVYHFPNGNVRMVHHLINRDGPHATLERGELSGNNDEISGRFATSTEHHTQH